MQETTPAFDWIHDWAELPVSPAFAHHGIAPMGDGNLLTARAEAPRCVVLSPEGAVLREFPVPVANAHSLECVTADDGERVWITDNVDCRVVCADTGGTRIAELTADDFPLPEGAKFCPTGTCADPVDGGLWVADGYGSDTVHHFDASLRHVLTLDGTNGAGKFRQPHSVFVDTRSEEPRIYVADRANHRVQIFTRDGRFLRSLDGPFRRPSAFAPLGAHLLIAELDARLTLCDASDDIVARLGDGARHLDREGWPNRLDDGGNPASPRDRIGPEEFNSPHGVCADKDGNVYVTEWLIGDRFTKLARRA